MIDLDIDLEDQELDALKATKNEHEWNELCDAIKAKRGGHYPQNWYSKVIMSGLMASLPWVKK
jgi:hypothetical protein